MPKEKKETNITPVWRFAFAFHDSQPHYRGVLMLPFYIPQMLPIKPV
jgi:hypothetical protein